MRARGYTLSVLVLAAVSYPALLDPSEDSFPLSTYPMFSRDRGRTAPVVSALAVGEGFERPLPPKYVANSEAMQALQTLQKTVRAGRRAALSLCRAIAERAVRDADPEFAAMTEVALVTRRVDAIRYLAGEEHELARNVHVRCRAQAPGRAKR